jgi:hypothetical protein
MVGIMWVSVTKEQLCTIPYDYRAIGGVVAKFTQEDFVVFASCGLFKGQTGTVPEDVTIIFED